METSSVLPREAQDECVMGVAGTNLYRGAPVYFHSKTDLWFDWLGDMATAPGIVVDNAGIWQTVWVRIPQRESEVIAPPSVVSVPSKKNGVRKTTSLNWPRQGASTEGVPSIKNDVRKEDYSYTLLDTLALWCENRLANYWLDPIRKQRRQRMENEVA